VPSYAGTSSYLLMSKYNNYYGIGSGDGHNKIAILDLNAKENDPIIPSVKVMNEVMTIVGPTHVPGEPQGVVYEWCINSAVVDPATSSVIAGSEDGHVYRWDLTSNTLSQSLTLNQPTGEAYTPSLVGPDGTIYSINNARLYAIGN
jgi:WD40 repeat protein